MLIRRFLPLLLLAIPLTVRAQEAAPIKFHRPLAKGGTYDLHVVVDSDNKLVTTKPGQLPDISELPIHGEFSAELNIVDVDEKSGEPKEFTLTFSSFTAGDPKQQILVKDTVVNVKRDDKDVSFTLKNKSKPNRDVLEILGTVYLPLAAPAATEDEAFGSPGPHKAGDSWPVNPEAAASQIATSDTTIDPKSLTGTTTLKAQTPATAPAASATPGIRAITTITATSFKPKVFPESLAIKTSDLKAQVDQVLPNDVNLPPTESTSTLDVHLVCLSTSQDSVKMEVTTHKMVKTEISPK